MWEIIKIAYSKQIRKILKRFIKDIIRAQVVFNHMLNGILEIQCAYKKYSW